MVREGYAAENGSGRGKFAGIFFEGPGGVREGYEAEKWSGRGRGPGGVDETQILGSATSIVSLHRTSDSTV